MYLEDSLFNHTNAYQIESFDKSEPLLNLLNLKSQFDDDFHGEINEKIRSLQHNDIFHCLENTADIKEKDNTTDIDVSMQCEKTAYPNTSTIPIKRKRLLSPMKIDEETIDQSRRTSQCTSCTTFPFIFPGDEHSNLRAIHTDFIDHQVPFISTFYEEKSQTDQWKVSAFNLSNNYLANYREIEAKDLANEKDLDDDLCLSRDASSISNQLKLIPQLSSQSLNKKNGNPINKIIKFINEENIDTEKNREQLFNLLNNNQSSVESKKKVLFMSKKLSCSSSISRKNSKKNCCSCKKSHCLKLYCECFKNGDYCDVCTCPNCLNKESFELLRQHSISHLKLKNKNAFKSVITENEKTETKKHIKGCKCKNSNCQKNYCECFQFGVSCSESCRCVSCKNGVEH